jgi:threonine aldolase
MRQVGVLAAAGLVALENSPQRLHEDHENAKALAVGIAQIPGLKIDPARVRTNIVIFDCSGTGMTAVELCDALHEKNVWAQDTAPHLVRMVTHWNVNHDGIMRALIELHSVVGKRRVVTSVKDFKHVVQLLVSQILLAYGWSICKGKLVRQILFL